MTRLQTSNHDVFAAGDCLPGPERFTHAAEWWLGCIQSTFLSFLVTRVLSFFGGWGGEEAGDAFTGDCDTWLEAKFDQRHDYTAHRSSAPPESCMLWTCYRPEDPEHSHQHGMGMSQLSHGV